jgi:hypothetical protein
LDRIEDMMADAICRDAVGYKTGGSPHYAIAAFNGHIDPIARLYGFELRMELVDGALTLYGDVGKANCVLLYLTSEDRKPETDWLLDVVTIFLLTNAPMYKKHATPSNWKKAWNKLRHRKRGQWWRRQRDKQIEATKVPEPEEPTPGPKVLQRDDSRAGMSGKESDNPFPDFSKWRRSEPDPSPVVTSPGVVAPPHHAKDFD